MRPLLFLVATLFVACSSSPTSPEQADGTVKLRFGESTMVGSVALAFSDINDSRCPTTVTCVWAGDAAVRLDAGTESLVLHSNSAAGPASGRIAGANVTLVEVTPQPVTPDSLKKSDYTITLRVSQ